MAPKKEKKQGKHGRDENLQDTAQSPSKRKRKADASDEAKSPSKRKRKADPSDEENRTEGQPPEASKQQKGDSAGQETAADVMAAGKGNQDGVEAGTADKEGSTDVSTAANQELENTSENRRPWNWKISSWNVNGIKAWMKKDCNSYIKKESPDVFCIQETKSSKNEIPKDICPAGYHKYWNFAEQKGYSGVGLCSKTKPLNVTYGIGVAEHDKEGRVITAEYDDFYLVTAYVPNSGRGLPRLPYRQEWDKDFCKYLKSLDKQKPIVLCGDLNVAHKEIDLANPKSNKKTAGFTQEERDGFTSLLKQGFVDTFRHFYPDKKQAYSFWTYMRNARASNIGWRLDYFVVSERLLPKVADSTIRSELHGSDHCPLELLLNL